MKMVNDIKTALELEVRVSPDSRLRFEAVFQSKDMDKLLSIVKNELGEAAKPAGKNVRLPKHVQKLVDSMGGLWPDQSFYLKETNGEYIYVALWPWQSDPSKTTLKVGSGRFEDL